MRAPCAVDGCKPEAPFPHRLYKRRDSQVRQRTRPTCVSAWNCMNQSYFPTEAKEKLQIEGKTPVRTAAPVRRGDSRKQLRVD